MNSTILTFGSSRSPQYVSAADLSWLFGAKAPSDPAQTRLSEALLHPAGAMSPTSGVSSQNWTTHRDEGVPPPSPVPPAVQDTRTPASPAPQPPPDFLNPQPATPYSVTALTAEPDAAMQQPTAALGQAAAIPASLPAVAPQNASALMARAASIPTGSVPAAQPVAALSPGVAAFGPAFASPAQQPVRTARSVQPAPAWVPPDAPDAAPLSAKPWEGYKNDPVVSPAASAQPMNVQGPDGSVVQFPAGTDEATVNRVMAQATYQNMSAGKQIAQAADDTARLVSNAALFGYGDKLAAAGDTGVGYLTGSNKTYADNLAAERTATQAARDRAGWAGVADEMLGAAGPTGAIARGVGAAIPALGRLGQAVATGGIAGAANAAGNDQAVGQSALIGGALGGAGVPVGKVAGMVAGPVAQRLADALYNATTGKKASLPAGAADALAGALARQSMTPADALAAARDLGTGATLADTGQATRDLTARLATRDPNVASTIASNLTDRADQFSPRINAATDQALGPDFDATAKLAALKSATAANGAQAYSKAFDNAAKIDVGPLLDLIKAQGNPGGVAVGNMSYLRAIGKELSDPAHNLESLHSVQQSLGDMADRAATMGDASKARVLTNTRNSLLDAMEQSNPNYAAARQGYASDKAVEDAFTQGRSLLATRSGGQAFDPDLLNAKLAGMSQPELDAYRLGARKSVADAMGQARSDPAGLQTRLANENGYAAGKLRALFGDDAVDQLQAELENQAAMRATNNAALAGSKTAAMTATDDLIPNAKLVGNVGHGAGGPLSLLAGAELGSHIGRMVGQEELGGALGAGAGLVWNNGIAPLVNASRQASASASRSALATALTGEPSDVLARALTKRAGSANTGARVSAGTQRLIDALSRSAAGSQSPAIGSAFGR